MMSTIFPPLYWKGKSAQPQDAAQHLGLGGGSQAWAVKSPSAEFCIKQKGYSQGRHFLPKTTWASIIKVYKYLCMSLPLLVSPGSWGESS